MVGKSGHDSRLLAVILGMGRLKEKYAFIYKVDEIPDNKWPEGQFSCLTLGNMTMIY